MSRILRRPMFRGGRVDGRGTGITSGLGYEKGGRVGLANGGGYKFGETPAAKGLGYLNNEFNKMLAAGYDLGAVPINTLGRLFGYNPGFSGTKFMNTMTGGDFLRNNPNLDPDIAYLIGQTSAKKGFEIPSMEKGPVTGVGRMGPPGGGETSLGSGKATYKKPKIDTGTGTGTRADEPSTDDLMAIDKEKFAKLLGSKEARGEDISNMLLSFAGKALKDDATVKSAFGEFAAEEAKRPSSKTKIDQAAAQLAINKYIKGEISKAEMEKLVMLNRTKISDQIALQKAALTLDTALQAGVKNQVGSSKKSIAVIQSAVEQVYGDKFNFGGPLPETAEEINVSTIYVKDNEKSSGAKDLVYIDPTTGNLEILKTIF